MYLKNGFLLKEKYEIINKTDFIGSTAVYFAKDKESEKEVKIKEFFPVTIM